MNKIRLIDRTIKQEDIELSAGDYSIGYQTDQAYDEYGSIMSCDDASSVLEDARTDIIESLFGEENNTKITKWEIYQKINSILWELNNRVSISWDTQSEESEIGFNNAYNLLSDLQKELNK